MTEPVLSRQDRDSAAWKKVEGHLQARLTTLRAQNDLPADERSTATLRGRIAEVKALLGLDKDQPVIGEEDLKFKD